jgi:uncharacterized LabA/DUF88 family protein
MDRCAVLVDAGYLLGAAGTLLAGDADRAGIRVDYQSLVLALIDDAEDQTGVPVLRLLWYDGAFNAQPMPEHRILRVLPDVKVRLGELVTRGGRVQQKGVDSYLQRDLTTLARNHAVSDVVLVGGDEDLRRSLEEAQDYGLRVHLWGVEAATPEYNQSQSLIAEADRRWVLSGDWIRRFVRRTDEAKAPEDAQEAAAVGHIATGAPMAASEGAHIVGGQPKPAGAQLATPADLARLAAAYRDQGRGAPPAGAQGRGWSVTRQDDSAGAGLPRLRDVTTPAQAWQDKEEDATGSSCATQSPLASTPGTTKPPSSPSARRFGSPPARLSRSSALLRRRRRTRRQTVLETRWRHLCHFG